MFGLYGPAENLNPEVSLLAGLCIKLEVRLPGVQVELEPVLDRLLFFKLVVLRLHDLYKRNYFAVLKVLLQVVCKKSAVH